MYELLRTVMSTRHNVCGARARAYVSLCVRWQKAKAINTWWGGLGEPAQVDWYRREGVLPAGTKKKYDQISLSESSEKFGESDEDEIDDSITWKWFKRWGLLGQKL